MAADERRGGFTLIEVMGAFFMMVVILVFVTGIFVENGRQRSAATELMRERLSVTGALELVANDLEGAVFLARPQAGEEDPDAFAWRVTAQDSGEYGARSLRFVAQNASRSNSAQHSSNWTEVAYFLEDDEEGQPVLWRWRSARPPSAIPSDFPNSNDPGSARIAVGVSAFGVRLLDAQGNWLDDWDSTYLPSDLALPEAAEISLALFRLPRRGEELDEKTTGVPGMMHVRRVSMVMRPIDVEAILKRARGEGDGETDCYKISECVNQGNRGWYDKELTSRCGGDGALCDLLQNPGANCWSEITSRYPQVAAAAPESCGS